MFPLFQKEKCHFVGMTFLLFIARTCWFSKTRLHSTFPLFECWLFRFSLEFNKVVSTQPDQDLVSFPNPHALESEAENLSNLDQTWWDNIALLRLFVYPIHGSSVPLRRVLVAHVLFKRGGVGATNWGLILWKFCKYIDLPKRKNITLLTVTQPR